MEDEGEFVVTETKKQRKRREKEKKRQLSEDKAEQARAAKLAKPSPLADNAAYAAVFGPDARGTVLLKPEYGLAANRFHLNPTHLQLLASVVCGVGVNHSTSPFVLGHQALISRAVFVSIGSATLDMITPSMSELMQSMFVFGHSVLVGPGSATKAYHVPPMVLRTPISKPASAKKPKEGPATWEELLATLDQLKENEFPMEAGSDGLAGMPEFVCTLDRAGCVGMAALDCEMVSTAVGFELGRVSLVGQNSELLFDSFVAPCNPVTDYNTRYSGLTEESLRGAPSLVEVRAKFLELISSKTLLVGHSLDNDLRCLRVVHLRVGDTSLLFPHSRGPPLKRSLRELASTYLQLNDFQAGEHCSIQDASVAMRLFLLKQQKGLLFGVPRRDFQSLFDGVRGKTGALVMTADLNEQLKAVIGDGIGDAKLMASATSSEEVLRQTGEAAAQGIGPLIYSLLPDCTDCDTLEQVLRQLKEHVHARLPSGTLFVVHGGRGSLSTLLELQQNRKGPEDDAVIAREALRIRSLPIWIHVV